MDSRISGLQADITKLQDDLRELQLKNARVTQQNEKLVEEVEDLRDVNEKLKKERDELINTNGRSADNASAPDASSAMGERAPGDPNGTSSTCAEPCDKDLPGRFASDAGASKSERLPAEVRNLVNGHANNRECHSHILRGRNQSILTALPFVRPTLVQSVLLWMIWLTRNFAFKKPQRPSLTRNVISIQVISFLIVLDSIN
jgi:hypothetical protein